MTIGERIYYCRIEQHMTQKTLGEKAGIDSATIGKYERGALIPKIETLEKIADALGVPISTLVDKEYMVNATVDAIDAASGKLAEAINTLGLVDDLPTLETTRALQEYLVKLDDKGQEAVVDFARLLSDGTYLRTPLKHDPDGEK